MTLTPSERPVVRRAVAAYLEAKKGHTGQFRGKTADRILEELTPSPVRWVELAALVIASAEGKSHRALPGTMGPGADG
jgi:hypothetical protein